MNSETVFERIEREAAAVDQTTPGAVWWNKATHCKRLQLVRQMGFLNPIYAKYQWGYFQPHTRADIDALVQSGAVPALRSARKRKVFIPATGAVQ